MEKSKIFCQYKEGICERTIPPTPKSCLFFAYPSKPKTSADAMQGAIKLLSKDEDTAVELIDWWELPIEGNIIFCEIWIRGEKTYVIPVKGKKAYEYDKRYRYEENQFYFIYF